MLDQPTSIKEINELRILNLLRVYPGISRSQIVSRTGLSKATVSTIVSEFIQEGVVCEAGAGVQIASAGRRPVKLRLNGQIRLAIGVELTGSECIATLTDLYSDPLRVVRYPMADVSVDASIDLIVQSVNQLLDGYDASRLLGVGVGVPGPVDATRQRVIQAENIGWFDVPLGPMLAERIGKPVTVVKRQNAGALGEHWHGIGKSHANLLYISVGVGIGCGIIVHGELYEGANGSAGEIGHITVVPDGHRCRCGNLGCLETLASCPAIAVRAREKTKEGRETLLADWARGVLQSITSDMVIEAARKGDPLAIEVIQEAASYLGIAIANVINLFNTSMVIIGGELLELGDLFLEPISEVVQRRAFSIPLSTVEVVPSSLGHNAAAIGAATLIIDHSFTLAHPFSERDSDHEADVN
jgi:glucokinase-like ROK family protein